MITMEASVFTQILLPIATALIMFGMGLNLTVSDFTRLTKSPVAVGAGVLGQMILMPLAAFGICLWFNLDPSLAIGLMILAACPGGTVSNICSQLAKANLALSVTLTAISTMLCVITSPFIIQFAFNHFAGEQSAGFSLLNTALGLFAITLIPVSIGIYIRRRFVSWAKVAERYFRLFSLFFMVAIVFALAIKERELLVSSFDSLFFACISLSLGSMSIGAILARLGGLNLKDAMTLVIEVGLQNATLAILIAVSFLESPQLAVSAGFYGLVMYIGPLLLIIYVSGNKLVGDRV